jgi:hypothetical protein
LIEARGIALSGNPACTVRLRAGERKVGGVWTWAEPALGGLYVGGTSNGRVQTLACDPVTRAVHFPALLHEMAHHWMIHAYADWRHDQRFKADFWLWRDVPAAQRAMTGGAGRVHYDVVGGGQ